MKEVLLNSGFKPYMKLCKLIQHAHTQGIITTDEGMAFEDELDLLLNGQNRSHNTIPRSYWDKLSSIKEAEVLHNGPWNEQEWLNEKDTNGLD